MEFVNAYLLCVIKQDVTNVPIVLLLEIASMGIIFVVLHRLFQSFVVINLPIHMPPFPHLKSKESHNKHINWPSSPTQCFYGKFQNPKNRHHHLFTLFKKKTLNFLT
jgi:hypothetical protein